MIIKIRETLKRGQTAMEYAMIVGAISLVLMGAWSVFGASVKQKIEGFLTGEVNKLIENPGQGGGGNNP